MIDLELARQFEMCAHGVEHGLAFGRSLRGRRRLVRVALRERRLSGASSEQQK
jgi:hypothetical protein